MATHTEDCEKMDAGSLHKQLLEIVRRALKSRRGKFVRLDDFATRIENTMLQGEILLADVFGAVGSLERDAKTGFRRTWMLDGQLIADIYEMQLAKARAVSVLIALRAVLENEKKDGRQPKPKTT